MCSACSGNYEDPDRTATDEELGEAVQVQTRSPQEPVRLSPEQQECGHPLEALVFSAYLQIFVCEQCGAEILIPDLDFPAA